ncbi:hypothetical protein AMS68_005329 [Peltaster fructicola]|uniref:Dienelactone hydrolase domain-containing protein n=1 Tax=Peltaster fructicola TaxID=286661 RepID=A0A6H0XYG4_9PEZI|nr:hypothetical protein AMS68_005329 [Peltaster fructicola]
MTSKQPARCCTIGVKHEGEAKGSLIEQNGISTYITKPEKASSEAILILPDVIGERFINAQLIADHFAANGYLTVIPDLFKGDPVKLNPPEGFDFMTWKAKHTTENTDPIVEKTIDYLKSEHGIKKIGGVGYCWGAKYVARYLTKSGGIDVGYFAHPSFVEENELRSITGPLSIAAAETDQIFTVELRHRSEEILKEIGAVYQLSLYSSVQHGFAVRGDVSNPVIKFAKEAAFLQAVQWFDEFLKNDRASAAPSKL